MSHTECILLALAAGFVIGWLCCTYGRDDAYRDGYRDGQKGAYPARHLIKDDY